MKTVKRTCLIFWLLLLLPPAGMAQLNRGTITGAVTDSAGAAVPRARITIQNIQTGASYQTESNDSGQYTMPNLPIGAYQLSFEAAGMKKFVRSGIELGVTEVLRVDAKLEVGAVGETIQISAEVPRLQTDTPELSTTMTNKQMVDIPFSFSGGRLMENFTYKTHPGIYGNRWTNNINGGPNFSRDALLDGASTTSWMQGVNVLVAVSMEAVQEFKVQTSGISAEFGRTQGGLYNYVMKSGANEIHGSAYGSLRNEALNANSFANNARGVRRGLDRRQNYAFSFGGPVWVPKVYDGRNKTFFFTAFEHYRERSLFASAPNRTLPIPEFYQGDFSRLLTTTQVGTDALGRSVFRGAIYDPATFRQVADTRPGRAGQMAWVGDPFPGNRIPVARFSQVSQRLNAIASKFHAPTFRDASGQIPLVNNSFSPPPLPRTDDYFFSIKGDQIINERHKLSGSYSQDVNLRLLAQIGGPWNFDEPNGGPLARSRPQREPGRLARLAYDWTISPTLLNHITLSYNRYARDSSSHVKEIDGAAELGIAGLSTPGYPSINWGAGPFVTLESVGLGLSDSQASNAYGFLDTVSFSRGRHFMKAGVDVRFNQRNHRTAKTTENSFMFNFDPLSTAIPGESFSGTQTGYSFASYLLGIVDRGAILDPVGLGDRRRYFAVFFQDDFKVTPKFTLNLGLRWEYQPPGYEAHDQLSSWNPAKIDPASGLPGAYDFAGDCQGCTGERFFGRKSFRNFSPRFGFAYQFGSGLTVRGAYGIYYEADMFNTLPNFGTALGKPTNVQAGGTWQLDPNPVNRWAGIFNWDSGVPSNRFIPPSLDVSWGNRNRPGMIDPDYGRTGYNQQWNLNVQRQLPFNVVLDAGYVGNKSTGLKAGELKRFNQLSPAVLSQFGSRLNNPVRNAEEAAANGIRYPYPGFQGTVGSALRPFPQVQGNQTVEVYGSPLGFSNYHALQLTLNRQFSSGATVYANYVWSKTLTNIRSLRHGDNPSRPLDYYDLRLEKSLAEEDRPHFLKLYFDYQLPIGRGKALWGGAPRVVNAILGGWGLSGIVNYGSGIPMGFFGLTPLAGAGGWNGTVNRANVAAGDLTTGFSRDNFDFFNPAAPNNAFLDKSKFSNPPPLTLGTAAHRLGGARNPMNISEDFALQKNHYFKEKYRLQIRADMLNAFNRTIPAVLSGDVNNPRFGQVTALNGFREIQITVRFEF